MVRLTTVEMRIYKVLVDERSHKQIELVNLLNEGHSNSLHVHLSNMRKKLRPKGLDIISENWRDGSRYRLVRIVGSD